jgi:hypothetical protein
MSLFHLKTMIRRKYSFLKLTQFSQVNNVLHAAASNLDGFIGEMHVFFSSLLKRTISSKKSLLSP